MTFREKLQHLTEDRIKAKVAARAGIGPTVLNNYLHRGNEPTASNALRLARALDVSVEWLIDDEQGLPVVWAEQRRAAEVA